MCSLAASWARSTSSASPCALNCQGKVTSVSLLATVILAAGTQEAGASPGVGCRWSPVHPGNAFPKGKPRPLAPGSSLSGSWPGHLHLKLHGTSLGFLCYLSSPEEIPGLSGPLPCLLGQLPGLSRRFVSAQEALQSPCISRRPGELRLPHKGCNLMLSAVLPGYFLGLNPEQSRSK